MVLLDIQLPALANLADCSDWPVERQEWSRPRPIRACPLNAPGCAFAHQRDFGAEALVSQWRAWLRPMRWGPGKCQQVSPELDALELRFAAELRVRPPGARRLAVGAAEAAGGFAELWRRCGALALVQGLAELEGLLPAAALPRLLRHFALRGALGAAGGGAAHSAHSALLRRAEAEVVGQFRQQLSRGVGCDVCCSDAACPHAAEASGLCASDTQFDAVQDLRDRLWSRAEMVLDAGPAMLVQPFEHCERVAQESSNNNLEEEVALAWNEAEKSSCVFHEVADAVYCHAQLRQEWRVFGAARALQQAALLLLLCQGCGPLWPLPFTMDELWHNFYVAIDMATKVAEAVKENIAQKHRDLAVLLGESTIWSQVEGTAGQSSMDMMKPQPLQGWHTCPLELGQVSLAPGRLEVGGNLLRGRDGTVSLQACHSAVVYHAHASSGMPRRPDERTLLVLPLSDVSFHISVAVRTWFGGALLLVHHFLGGPGKVTILLADEGEAPVFAELPRRARYGGNHGGFGVQRRLGKMSRLCTWLSDVPPLWLSTASGARSFGRGVWGFPSIGMDHGRGSDYDCSGSFCFGLRRWGAAGRVATLRPALDLPAPEVRGAKSVRLLLVQRSQRLSRRIVGAEMVASAWRGAQRALRLELWRPEVQSLAAQAQRLAGADILAAVTGQACGLGIFLRRGRVLLEFTPAIDSSYGCRWGWDMNPTSEVGQIARLGELHHHCVMARPLGVAANTPADARRSAELALQSRSSGDQQLRAEAGLTWRTAAKVVMPALGASGAAAETLAAMRMG
ncbi:unnamed protein product [Effrenium voratum]|uniref:Uncharacterized protein n=1 Tax=Effrenium voratum TaxID=2562239 RepID=A0AA36JAE3_9DINO|nr:unnamed protein product [Effrenium voratum]